MVARPVAVVLWLGGNHRLEITGPAAKATGPPSPTKMLPRLANLQCNSA